MNPESAAPAPEESDAAKPPLDRREFVRAELLVAAGATASAGAAVHSRLKKTRKRPGG